MYFQAAYVIPAALSHLKAWVDTEPDANNGQLEGLLDWISTFEAITTLPLSRPSEVHPLYAIAYNLLTRGRPVMPSVYLEEQLAKRLKATQEEKNNQRGSIHFPLREDTLLDPRQLFLALHPVVPERELTADWYDFSATDSAFERSFITGVGRRIPVLKQLMQQQRPISSIVRGYRRGEVDFSIESPYFESHRRINRYNVDVALNHRDLTVIEVDGAAYHNQLIDAQRDFAVASLGNDTCRITEANQFKDAEETIKFLHAKSFVQACIKNHNDAEFTDRLETNLILQPIAIARLQRILLEYQMCYAATDAPLTVAIIERDIQCAELAVADLNRTLTNLHAFATEVRPVRKIIAHQYSTLNFNPSDYELVIDISMLRRSGLFAEDRIATQHSNLIQLRNVHFVTDELPESLTSAKPIVYRALTNEVKNEVFQDNEEVVTIAEYFLQDLFRKQAFRPGQTPILTRALQRKPVIGLLPTGGGKSLTFQLAALLQPGITIVVDPIRSLMIDQDRSLRTQYIDRSAFINSTLTTQERQFAQNELLVNGRLHFVFISPERFVIQEFRNALTSCSKNGHFITYVVIDEAHCVSEWGHDFRIPYLNLGVNAQRFCINHPVEHQHAKVPLIGLTATASFDVLTDIERELQIADNDGRAVVRFENTVRDEIVYHIEKVEADDLNGNPPWSYRNAVGKPKQSRIFGLLIGKNDELAPYNTQKFIGHVAATSYRDYLGTAAATQISEEDYEANAIKRLHFNSVKTAFAKTQNKFDYGVIVFAPHRSGALGVKSIFDHDDFTSIEETVNVDEVRSTACAASGDRLGYFMGASGGNMETSSKVDRESFDHMDRFTEGYNSVMVATKAFGMGIDKPNIRLTIHLNLPGSIESFVQEAGRAGRDGKIALSKVLFNNEQWPDLDKDGPVSVDENVLQFFHKLSFQGEEKERAILYEIRNEIRLPKIKRMRLWSIQLDSKYPELNGCKFSYWANHGIERLYLTSDDIDNGSYVDLIGNNHRWIDFPYSALEWISSEISNAPLGNLRIFCNELVSSPIRTTGVEKQFMSMEVGESSTLQVFASNGLENVKDHENQSVISRARKEQMYEKYTELSGNDLSPQSLARVASALNNSETYEEWLGAMELGVESEALLKDFTQRRARRMRLAYLAPRTNQDTGKAIYRLSSIGIIDDYTIDYQNGLYELHFTKQENEVYFQRLQNFVARYSSQRKASEIVQELKKEKQLAIENGEATVIGVCLDFLTNYIYDNIRLKRQRAIRDMVQLCRQAIKIEDRFEHNRLIRDEIFYYFNAKYSRPDFVEEVGGIEFGASLIDDIATEATPFNLIEKYLNLVESAETGEFINNVKHLRGSTMRMLRAYPSEPHLLMLKGFALFCLGTTLPQLREEAITECTEGVVRWRISDPTFDADVYLAQFERRLRQHITEYEVAPLIKTVLMHAEVRFYSRYIKTLNDRILNTSSDE